MPLLPPYARPQPMPDAEQRKVAISVTGIDRLRSDPYQFYASAILGLRTLDRIDAEPSPAWRGEAVHEILDRWHKAGDPPGGLHAIAALVLDEMSAHPLMRSLWRPRLIAALDWIDVEIAQLNAQESRSVLVSEAWGDMQIRGVRIHGRADRIDRVEGDGLAIVDYKTGKPPSRSMVKRGYSLQLGLIGLIAQAGGFTDVAGEPDEFEYWSLAKDIKRRDEMGFGYVSSPFKTNRADGVFKEEFLERTAEYLNDALDRWILGSDPFTARLNPDLNVYNDYDQLMRLEEWLRHMSPADEDEA
jgi:ATP-dependent helicase/nuclease subunit B